MLDPEEKHAFDEMVTHLRSRDSKFVRRIDRLANPSRRPRVLLAVGLWMLAPVAIVLGGWTGLLMAVVGSAYAAHLVIRRPGFGGAPWYGAHRSVSRPTDPR